jgi:hypothetical protein
MSKEDYRDNAVECLRLANEAANPATRASLLRMAESWHRLYDQAERNALSDLFYETPLPPTTVSQQQQQRAEDED